MEMTFINLKDINDYLKEENNYVSGYLLFMFGKLSVVIVV